MPKKIIRPVSKKRIPYVSLMAANHWMNVRVSDTYMYDYTNEKKKKIKINDAHRLRVMPAFVIYRSFCLGGNARLGNFNFLHCSFCRIWTDGTGKMPGHRWHISFVDFYLFSKNLNGTATTCVRVWIWWYDSYVRSSVDRLVYAFARMINKLKHACMVVA